MPKQEILPPIRSQPSAEQLSNSAGLAPPRFNSGGIVSSTLTRWEAGRHSRTAGAVTERTRAEAALFDAQSVALESYIKRQRAAFQLQELPEILAAERMRRRMTSIEGLNQLQHEHDLASMRRRTERTHAEVALVDAEQALRAQREFGHAAHELRHKKQICEMLDVELGAAERRAILRQHMVGLGGEPERGGRKPDDLEEALYQARAELNANGLDTSRIDAMLSRLRSGR